ncbi:uncharacterized protein METZ01_LOCUS81075 [marine metagenome]|jgi:hypothetical protein|uniref:Uncharacterized protein n=1 Tax=marine metagenome TaxID=408172 RepID=A0A381UKE9_9ZZZZ|tara:strand:+ start:3117 stop:3683 length:567 start_codon:yes stop_codon:yes gene_type:complete
MASNIDNTSIDATYPIAGQDNDSQGFRNNFSTIKNNFIAAKNEIEDLQTNTAKLNDTNDFLGNDITGGNLVSNTEKLYAGGTIVAPQNISFANGNFQTFTIGANITLTFTDWPAANKVAKIRIMLLDTLGDSTARTVTWATEGGGTIKYSAGFPSPFVVEDELDPIVVDFWSYDGGTTVFAHYISIFT